MTVSCWITIVVAIYIWLMSFGSTFHLGFFWQGVTKNVSLNQTARVVAHNIHRPHHKGKPICIFAIKYEIAKV